MDVVPANRDRVLKEELDKLVTLYSLVHWLGSDNCTMSHKKVLLYVGL